MKKLSLSLILVCLILSLVLFSCQPKPAEPAKDKTPEAKPAPTTPVTPPVDKPMGTGPEGTPPPGGEVKPGDTGGAVTPAPPGETKPGEPPKKEPPPGLAIYTQNCVTCHKVSDKPDIPAKGTTDLKGIGKKYSDAAKMKEKLGKAPHDAIIKKLKQKDVDDLVKFLLTL